MRLATYEHNGEVSFGVVVGEGIVDLTPRIGDKYSGVLELLRAEALSEAENVSSASAHIDAAGNTASVPLASNGALKSPLSLQLLHSQIFFIV